MKKINDKGLLGWEIEKQGFWFLETKKSGKQMVNKAGLVRFLEARGITEMPIAEVEKLFVEEYEKEKPVIVEEPKIPEGYKVIDLDGDRCLVRIQEPKQDEAESAKLQKNGFSNIFNDDEAEEGTQQAMENAGVPKLLRGGESSDDSDDMTKSDR